MIVLIDQFINIFLYSWMFIIAFRRIICNSLLEDKRASAIKSKILDYKKYHYGDICALTASLVAICTLSNQYNYYSLGEVRIIERSTLWILFHKLITLSYIIRFRNDQPQILTDLIKEIKHKLWTLIDLVKDGYKVISFQKLK